MFVAQGKAARPQPWDESRVMEGAPRGESGRASRRDRAQQDEGGAGMDSVSVSVSVSVRAKTSGQLQTHLRLRLHLPLKRRNKRFLLRLFNSSTIQLFNLSPSPSGAECL